MLPKFAVLAVSIASLPLAASAADKVTYDDQVLPIFRNVCLNCHNPDKKKAGLDLSTYQTSLQGSENGKVLDSGNPAGSLLVKCVKQTEDPKMPPKGDKLSDADIAVIEKWIAGQLLENATGKAVAASNNKVSVAVVSLDRPDGPPPMPGELPLEPVVRTRNNNALTALAVSPWAPLVAVGGQKQVLLYHTETFEPLGVLPFPEGFPTIIRFSRNGQLLLTGGGLGGKSGKVVLWDIKTGERIATLGNEFDQVLAADLSPDQQFVALGGPNKLVKIYATKDGKLVTSIKKHTDWVTAIAYSPDGRLLASADRNGGIQLSEGSSGKEFNSLPGHKAMVTGLAFMPGVLASSSEDGKVALWDVKEGKEIRSWVAHSGGAAWVDFTPDGRLVSCGRDKIAKAWDQNGQQIGKTEPFPDITLRAVLTNDRVIAGDWTGVIRVSTLGGKELGQLTANPPTLADRVAETTKRLGDLQAALPGLQQQFNAATQKVSAEKVAAGEKRKAQTASLEAAKALPGQLEKRLADGKAQIAPITRQRDSASDADRPAAQQILDAQNKLIAATQAEFEKAKTALAASLTAAAAAEKAAAAQPAKPSPAEEELAKAKAAFDQATAQLAEAHTGLEKWKLAQIFQTVHNARTTLAGKQAQYDGLVQAVKDALQPIDRVHGEIAAAEKAAVAAATKITGKEKLLAQAQQAAPVANQAIGVAEAALADRQAALKTIVDSATQAAAARLHELTKQLAAQNAEVTPLREARAAKPEGSPERAEADKLVQAKEGAIAKAQAALDQAKAAPKPAETPEAKAVLAEITKARETLDKTRAAAREASDKLTAADKELAQAKAEAAQAQKQLTELHAKEPEIVKTAQAAKAEAERALDAAAKDLATAKTEAEKLRANYEQAKGGGAKSAALNVPPKG